MWAHDPLYAPECRAASDRLQETLGRVGSRRHEKGTRQGDKLSRADTWGNAGRVTTLKDF